MTPQLSSSPVIGIDVSASPLGDLRARHRLHLPLPPARPAGAGGAPARLRPRAHRGRSHGWAERPLLQALCAAGLPVTLVNPYRVRLFARSLGQWAKTDRLDAQVLVRYGESASSPLLVLPRPGAADAEGAGGAAATGD